MKKKLLAIFIAVAMTVCLIPTMVSADDDEADLRINGRGITESGDVSGITGVKEVHVQFYEDGEKYDEGAVITLKNANIEYDAIDDEVEEAVIEYGNATETATKAAFIAQGKSYKKSVKYSWTPVEGATQYKVYQVKCGKKKYKKVKTTTGLTYTKKKLKRRTTYKAYVVAYNSAGQAIDTTPIIHNMTKKGKRSNATAVSAKATADLKAEKQ